MSQREKPKLDQLPPIKKILLIRLRRIGDIIMTTPAITALGEKFPQTFISYVVEEPYRELVEGNPYLHHILVLPPNQNARGLIKTIHQIQHQKYDVAVDFHGGPRASLLTFLSHAKLKIGYKIKYKNFIYDYKIPRKPEKGYFHSVENHFNLVKVLGIERSAPPPLNLPQPQKKEIENIDHFLSSCNLHPPKLKKVVLHVGAGNQFRNWGMENLLHLIHRLVHTPQTKVILVGSNQDRPAEEKILQQSSSPLLSAVGRFNLRELKELISRSALFVGPDSGPMHVAATTSAPIVAYFGPTLPVNFAPWRANTTILEKEMDCRPCRQKKCIYQDFRCLRNIKPEEVYQACLKYLQ